MKKRLLTIAALTACLTAGVATAQEQRNRLETNLPGVTTAGLPPEGFDHLTASEDELALYGFPPKPDEMMEPAGYASWKRAMAASKERISPRLEQTRVSHGPARQVADSTGTSTNWSGVVDFGGATTYEQTTSFHFVNADYVVPVATQPYGVCTGSWVYSSTWVGIDGWNSNDVLQAGTSSNAYCGASGTATEYFAWYEWFPNYAVRISNFPIAPGDDLYIEVWNTTATQGYAYITNYSTNKSVTLGFTAPAGTKLVGNSAEWVIERPGINGSQSNLANYVSDYFSNCLASTWSHVSYNLSNASALQLTMVDNAGQPISFPTVLGSSAIWFKDEGSAR
jgi:hypothetical protein